MRLALSEGVDWVWLMDDDGVPATTSLQELLGAAAQRPTPTVLNSTVVDPEDPEVLTFGVWQQDEHGRPRRLISNYASLAALAGPAGYFEGWGCFFNGTLLPREVIRTVGFPDGRFFIRGDEVDYYFRVRRTHPIATVLAATHYHRRPTGSIHGIKLYYACRNSLHNERRYYCQSNAEVALFFVWSILRLIYWSCAAVFRFRETDFRARAFACIDAACGIYRSHATICKLLQSPPRIGR